MGRGGLMREIHALLDHHGLTEDAKRLEAARRDPGTVLDVLLGAYRKTCDGLFFSLFVRMTWPLLAARARRILRQSSIAHESRKAILDAYAFILKETLAPRSSSPARNWMAALDVLEDRLLEEGATVPSSRQGGSPIEERRARKRENGSNSMSREMT
jgi:hypothetical protein